ncbi:MAG: DUF72 domain-containing protein, partial [Bdellovibrio sp.]|nr:DUF72 domain-containing protein [Bdellovibrio sp.]
MSIRIGISGWVYPNWRKVFYPPDLAQKDELAYASRQLTSIEINSSFYRNQSIQSYRRWYSQVPDNFIFSVKGPQYITHILRLRKTEEALANFFASGVLSLNEKLGAFLWQLPPNFLFDEERLENFFRLLPKTMSEALTLADRSTKYPATYSEMNLTSKRRLQHALEVRNHSFENPDFIKLLRKYN